MMGWEQSILVVYYRDDVFHSEELTVQLKPEQELGQIIIIILGTRENKPSWPRIAIILRETKLWERTLSRSYSEGGRERAIIIIIISPFLLKLLQSYCFACPRSQQQSSGMIIRCDYPVVAVIPIAFSHLWLFNHDSCQSAGVDTMGIIMSGGWPLTPTGRWIRRLLNADYMIMTKDEGIQITE